MNNLLTEEAKNSIRLYRIAGIDIEVLHDNVVRIKQSRLINGYILTNKGLHDRARAIFPDKSVKIIPVVYSFNADDINIKWVTDKMGAFGIHRNDLIKQLALDKATISLYFSGERKLTRTAKAAFFYYFLVYELNSNREA